VTCLDTSIWVWCAATVNVVALSISVKPSLDSFLGLMRWTITNIERLGEKSDSDLHEMADICNLVAVCCGNIAGHNTMSMTESSP